MNIIKEIKWYLFVCIFCSSCTSIYFPNTINTPMFDEEGQVCASVNFSSDYAGQYSIDYQSALSILNNIAIQYDYSCANNKSNEWNYLKYNYYEFGIGYFRSSNDMFKFENYIGHGVGKLKRSDNDRKIEGEYNRIYLCSTFGISKKLNHDSWFDPDKIELGITTRISRINWNMLEYDYSRSFKRENYYFEPAIFIRVGWKNLLFQGQYGQIFPYYKDDFVESSNGWVSFGILTYFDLY